MADDWKVGDVAVINHKVSDVDARLAGRACVVTRGTVIGLTFIEATTADTGTAVLLLPSEWDRP